MPKLDNMIAKFNAKAQSHQNSQKQNPFSGSFSGKKLTTRPGQENYGRPVTGSKTEKRGFQAKSHINKETLELCETIYELACYNLELMKRAQEEDPDFDGITSIDDGPVIVTFGDLFEVYTRINNKVVGLLLAAKKKGLVFFEKEMLFQRRDDDELIMLNKPIQEIRQIMKAVKAPSPVLSVSPSDSDDDSNKS